MHNNELYSNVAIYVHNYPNYLLEVTMKFFMGYFCSALASGVYYLTIAKYSWENFCSTLKNFKTTKV